MKNPKAFNLKPAAAALGALLLAIFLSSAGCAGRPATTAPEPAELGGRTWNLEEIDGRPALAKTTADGMGTNGPPSLVFSGAKLEGFTGCNRLTGETAAHGKNLRLTPTAVTVIGCREPLMLQERDFTAALRGVTRYEIDGVTLRLYADDRLVLKFRGAETP